MPAYQFERDARTPFSESYVVEIDGDATARVDLHFTAHGAVHATLCVPADADEDAIQDLIGEVDERIVLAVDPMRLDFIVTVWRGSPAGVYSEEEEDEDDDDADDDAELDDDEDDTEPPGNGRARG